MLSKLRKIVIKVGSNTLSDENGFINEKFIENLTDQVARLVKQGKEVIIVSSGAKIAGISALNKWSRKSDIHYKQALCAIGQVRLLEHYRKNFTEHDMHIAQILLTRDDFTNDNRVLNIRNTLFTLVDEGVVPIINENDTVCVEELKIGDNDTLGALTARIWNADVLVILSDIAGLYDKNPKDHDDAKLLEQVHNVDSIIDSIEIGESNSFGTGGIKTKLDAAKLCNEYEIPMILADGSIENVIDKLINDEIPHTIFMP
ncbi:MAG: glutamate 5-kinase [Clostridia bacterium]